MSAWVELYVKGGHRAVLAADSVVGVVLAKGSEAQTVATPDAPLTLILRGGETLPPVYGLSAADLLLRMDCARLVHKRHANPTLIVYLDSIEKFWSDLDAVLNDGAA